MSLASDDTAFAIGYVRRMRGGAQAQLLHCSDGCYYVVKFSNNPQDVRVLANEMFVSRLGRALGLPVPIAKVINVSRSFISSTNGLTIQKGHSSVPCRSGLQFGSQYVVEPMQGKVFDFLPPGMFDSVRNIEMFAGMLVLDKWTCNCDARQAVFWRKQQQQRYTVAFVDHGYCFNCGEWNFPDSPLRGVYQQHEVYDRVHSMDSFEPWLARIEHLGADSVEEMASSIPIGWYRGDRKCLKLLTGRLVRRKSELRRLIEDIPYSSLHPFRNWQTSRHELELLTKLHLGN